MVVMETMYDFRFEEKKYEVFGYCPQCDEAVLSCHDRKYDGEDYWHKDCYKEFKECIDNI